MLILYFIISFVLKTLVTGLQERAELSEFESREWKAVISFQATDKCIGGNHYCIPKESLWIIKRQQRSRVMLDELHEDRQ